MIRDSYIRRAAAARDGSSCLCGWGARALYIGPAFDLSPHRNAVAVLALGLDAPFAIAEDPAQVQGDYRACRSALIFPNTLHHLRDTRGRMAFLYLDASSADLVHLRRSATSITQRCAFDLASEAAWLGTFDDLSHDRQPWPQIRHEIAERLGRTEEPTSDARIRETLDALHASVGTRLVLSELARSVGLSASRLRHLFKEMTGVPLSRYRLWIALSAAMRAILQGDNLTQAAMDSGFASSAHFSSTYRGMFGLEPSRLARLPWAPDEY